MELLKDRNEPPMIWDVNQFDWFIDEEFLNVGQELLKQIEKPRGDQYRECIEHRRAEIKEICALILNKLQGTEDKSAPRTVLFSLPLEEMGA